MITNFHFFLGLICLLFKSVNIFLFPPFERYRFNLIFLLEVTKTITSKCFISLLSIKSGISKIRIFFFFFENIKTFIRFLTKGWIVASNFLIFLLFFFITSLTFFFIFFLSFKLKIFFILFLKKFFLYRSLTSLSALKIGCFLCDNSLAKVDLPDAMEPVTRF